MYAILDFIVANGALWMVLVAVVMFIPLTAWYVSWIIKREFGKSRRSRTQKLLTYDRADRYQYRGPTYTEANIIERPKPSVPANVVMLKDARARLRKRA